MKLPNPVIRTVCESLNPHWDQQDSYRKCFTAKCYSNMKTAGCLNMNNIYRVPGKTVSIMPLFSSLIRKHNSGRRRWSRKGTELNV